MFLSIIGQIFGFIGSLCLLLFGMNMLSDGIQKGAGSNLQKMLGKITGNRFAAVLTGIGVTAVIQSSGATTVMVVSFVNAEILTLTQAIGVIFGANIGTTVTAWIVSFFGFSFSISAAAIPLFGLGFILKYFKQFKIHNFADCFMGFALLFMGLGLLKDTLSLSPSSVAFLQKFDSIGIAGILLGVFIGAFVTALIHSSSAMTAIVLTMAANGSLSWELSAAIVLGSNIGSTIDAVMSSFGASVNARRTALVHVGFNVAGTLIALLVFKPFLALVDLIVPGIPSQNITTHIAMLHTIFNLCATLIFIPFVDQIASLAKKIIKDNRTEENEHYKLPAILPYSHVSADLYSFQIQKEITKMSIKVMEMFDCITNTLTNEKNIEEENKTVNAIENYVDEMNIAITGFLQKCSRLPTANSTDRNNFARLIQITDNLENLSDECSSIMHTIGKFFSAYDDSDKDIKPKRTKEISDYLEMVRIFYEQICIYLSTGISSEERLNAEIIEQKIDDKKKTLRRLSRKRIENGSDVKIELNYIDLVRKIEKAGDCAFSIVQVS
ncbi:MAG: Na/Pi cotransporter family protein [Spirochaetia bacterium]|nr:Na/Pi cotransporter family protein [Spirochaetia bacterium]